jgi:hypothetical protein
VPPARTPHEKHFVWGRGSSHQNICTSTVSSLRNDKRAGPSSHPQHVGMHNCPAPGILTLATHGLKSSGHAHQTWILAARASSQSAVTRHPPPSPVERTAKSEQQLAAQRRSEARRPTGWSLRATTSRPKWRAPGPHWLAWCSVAQQTVGTPTLRARMSILREQL